MKNWPPALRRVERLAIAVPEVGVVGLNMLTVQLAQELRGTKIAVNSVSPGYVKTDLTGNRGFLTAEEGARLPVTYALLGEDAVSGRFVEASGETPW